MSIGARIRKMFGRNETYISEIYRSIFLNLDDLAQLTSRWSAAPKSILEVGCGEGMFTQRLEKFFPHAQILGIDITETIGRLHPNHGKSVEFRKCTSRALSEERKKDFDLIIMCDVLHHIPIKLRKDIMASIFEMISPGGCFILKDWTRGITPIHIICFLFDRFITGDKVKYANLEEIKNLIQETFGFFSIVEISTVRPWHHNKALLIKP